MTKENTVELRMDTKEGQKQQSKIKKAALAAAKAQFAEEKQADGVAAVTPAKKAA